MKTRPVEDKKGRRIMVIASGGGHWVQMRRIIPAFEGLDCFYVSTDPAYAEDVPGQRFYSLRSVTRRNRFGFVVLFFQLLRILAKERPQVVITTGSAPGLVALALSKGLLRTKTIWIDSVANVDRLSTSGRLSRYVADVWLTQWEHLAKAEGPDYWGAVL